MPKVPQRDFTLVWGWRTRDGEVAREKEVGSSCKMNPRRWDVFVWDPWAKKSVQLVRLAARLKEQRFQGFVQAVGRPQPPAWLEKAPAGPLEDSAGGVAWQHSLISSLQLIFKQRRYAR